MKKLIGLFAVLFITTGVFGQASVDSYSHIENTPTEKLLWLLPSIVSTVYSVVTLYQGNEILKKKDFRYLTLIDKKLSDANRIL